MLESVHDCDTFLGLIDRAVKAYPNRACGIVYTSGKDVKVLDVHNEAVDKETDFFIDFNKIGDPNFNYVFFSQPEKPPFILPTDYFSITSREGFGGLPKTNPNIQFVVIGIQKNNIYEVTGKDLDHYDIQIIIYKFEPLPMPIPGFSGMFVPVSQVVHTQDASNLTLIEKSAIKINGRK